MRGEIQTIYCIQTTTEHAGILWEIFHPPVLLSSRYLRNIMEILAKYPTNIYPWIRLINTISPTSTPQQRILSRGLTKWHQCYFSVSHSVHAQKGSLLLRSPQNVNWQHVGALKMYVAQKCVWEMTEGFSHRFNFPEGDAVLKSFGYTALSEGVGSHGVLH